MRFAELYEAGDAWLADCHAHPNLVREAWSFQAAAPIRTGTSWLAAESSLVPGMKALYRMREEHRGPVLADPPQDRMWWLVPLNAADELADVRQVCVQPAGSVLHCPPTGQQVWGRFWLSRPDGSGLLTDPTVLGAAFGPGGYRLPTEAFA
ncbi:hypothetical protein FNH09_23510 [Streptomyces adustus]|uniref:Uncharacterized protein n=1 Tax=Streptomyces adustus TaxID=1609272 RepID=A0A5N8VGZ4_9ACTN|nr:hypothetical protein [Streptomyces adustus]MPY34106.1 hypothetical protein [Streptomyces adustus]